MAKFYGVGVGPGDPELLTIKAVNAIKMADVIYAPISKESAPSLAHTIAKQYIPEKTRIKRRHFPMVFDKGGANKAWQSIADEIICDVQSLKNVVFLTLGDPMIYSTYVYTLEFIKDNVEIVTIPGISSFSNIASSQNFPLVMDKSSMIIVPATIDIKEIESRIKEFDSLVLMKVFKKFNEIKEIIIENSLLENTMLVCWSSFQNEEVYYPITDCEKEKLSYFSTIVINKNWKK